MKRVASRPQHVCWSILFVFALISARPLLSEQPLDGPQVPPKFTLDFETAARLRPQLIAESDSATGRYAVGRLVFDRLIAELPHSATTFRWELRIVGNDGLNAYASPDGAIFVESGLAQLAGPSTGLWGAILAHEVAHVMRRDWARRYLYQKSLENGGSAVIALGDPGLPSASWSDSRKSSETLARFCRQLELEADRESLMLMARSGFHPDFVPALHHLLHAKDSAASSASLYAMHPCWEERDRELSGAYSAASIEFEHRWPEWHTSPGGNPPVVVFTEAPKLRKSDSNEWQIQFPMRCQNLSGTVEVVLRDRGASKSAARLERLPDELSPGTELRQLTGCTSTRTMITFPVAGISGSNKPASHWTDVYILDSWGAVLARADAPKPPR